MSKCKNCGSELKNSICEYCGTANNLDLKSSKGLTENFLGINFADFSKKMSNAIAAQQQFNETGKFDDDTLKQMSEGFGFNEMIQDLTKHNNEMNDKIKLDRAKLKAARVAIAKGKCPECGEPFKKRHDFCDNCGASVMIESYDDC